MTCFRASKPANDDEKEANINISGEEIVNKVIILHALQAITLLLGGLKVNSVQPKLF